MRKHGATAGEVSGQERRCSSAGEGGPVVRASTELSDESCATETDGKRPTVMLGAVRKKQSSRKDFEKAATMAPLAREREE